MKQRWKFMLILILSLFTAMTGCGDTGASAETDIAGLLADAKAMLTGDLTADEAKILVQGDLDTLYHKEAQEDYMTMTEATQEEIDQGYAECLVYEAEFFAQYYAIDYLTEDIESRLVALFDQVYAMTDYTVGEPTRGQDEGFVVNVSVRPVDVMDLINEDIDSAAAGFYEQYTQEQVDAMDEAEYQAYDAQWAEIIIGLFEENLPDSGYLPERTVSVNVTKDEDGLWGSEADGISQINEIIIQYS